MDYEGESRARSLLLLRRAFPYARPLAQLALVAGLLAALVWRVDTGAVRDDLRHADLWWLPLAFSTNLLSDWFRAIRWQRFLLPLKRVPIPFLFATAVLGVATNIALPLRAGEVLRVQVLRRRTGLRVSSIVATLLSEKLMDILAFCTFIILGLVLYEEARFLWPVALAYGLLLGGGLYGAHWLARRAARPPAPAGRLDGRIRSWIAREMRAFGEGLQAFRSPRAMFTISWASLAAWLSEATMYYACGRAIGLDLSPAVYLLVVVAATIAISVPVTQAGLGVFELAITGLLVAFGVGDSQAAAFAIFTHVMLALPYMASGPLCAFGLRLSLSDVFAVRMSSDRDRMARGAAPVEVPAGQ